MVEEVSVYLTSFEVDEADRKCIEVQKLFCLYLYSSFEYVFVCVGWRLCRIWRWMAMVTVQNRNIVFFCSYRIEK